RRWQNRRAAEDQAVLKHKETLEALAMWQHSLRQMRLAEGRQKVAEKLRIASVNAQEQTMRILEANSHELTQRVKATTKQKVNLQERLDRAENRKEAVAFFRQWLNDVQH